MPIRHASLWLLCILGACLSYGQSPADGVHVRSGSYWSAYEGRQSTVQLHNNLVNVPIAITPILYLGNGPPWN